MPDTVLLQLAGQFLYKVKLNEPTTELEKQLAALDYNQLKNGLNNDNAIKSFWLNMYNGWFQVLAVREKLTRPAIFSSKVITIASKNSAWIKSNMVSFANTAGNSARAIFLLFSRGKPLNN